MTDKPVWLAMGTRQLQGAGLPLAVAACISVRRQQTGNAGVVTAGFHTGLVYGSFAVGSQVFTCCVIDQNSLPY